MIDIHSHILASVDDGSKDLAMSIDMAKIYLQSGIKKVICTPHYIADSMDNCLEDNRIALGVLNKELVREELDLEVFLGNEIYVSIETINDILEKKVSTLAASRYVLLELPMHDIPMNMENLIYELQLRELIPIIAHPERNMKIVDNPNILYEYIQRGAFAQLNIPSLEGVFGNDVRNTAELLLKHKMIHFVGTDAHTNESRSPAVKEGLGVLRSIVKEDEFEEICFNNPECILRDNSFIKKSPLKYEEKKRFFRLLKTFKFK